jgi:hypothetical protein
VDVIDLGAARRAKQPSVSWPDAVAEQGLAHHDDCAGDDRLSVRASLLVVALVSGLLWASLAAVIGALVQGL